MTSTELYQEITRIAKKEVYGPIKVADFIGMFNVEQSAYMEDLVGRIRDYQPGRPIPPVHVEATKRIEASLSPFAKTVTVNLSGGYGLHDPDADFIHGPLSVGATGWSGDCSTPQSAVDGRIEVDWVGNSEWNDRTRSGIDNPTNEWPMGRFGAPTGENPKGWIQVAPKTVSAVEFKYIMKPPPIFLDGTYDPALGGFVPNPGSTLNADPLWYDIDMKYLIGKTLLALGVHLDDQQLMQYGVMKEAKGV